MTRESYWELSDRLLGSNAESEHIQALAKKPRQVPPVLFHYTSLDAFTQIIAHHQLRFTDIRYLNDAREFIQGWESAKKAIREVIPDSDERPLYDQILASVAGLEPPRLCVFSLSAVPDLLGQWRAYCPPASGVAIGFDTQKLTTLAKKVGFLERCIYEAAAQHDLITAYFRVALRKFVDPQFRSPGASLSALAAGTHDDFIRLLTQLSAVMKDPAFADEREWRLVAIPTPDRPWDWKQRVGRHMLIPFVEVEWAPLTAEDPLHEVIVAPTHEPALAVESVTRYLAEHGYTTTRVTPTEIRYRSW